MLREVFEILSYLTGRQGSFDQAAQNSSPSVSLCQ